MHTFVRKTSTMRWLLNRRSNRRRKRRCHVRAKDAGSARSALISWLPFPDCLSRALDPNNRLHVDISNLLLRLPLPYSSNVVPQMQWLKRVRGSGFNVYGKQRVPS